MQSTTTPHSKIYRRTFKHLQLTKHASDIPVSATSNITAIRKQLREIRHDTDDGTDGDAGGAGDDEMMISNFEQADRIVVREKPIEEAGLTQERRTKTHLICTP